MRKLSVVLCIGMFAFAANAASIEFYFSLQGDTSGIPEEYTNQTTLTVDCYDVVYVWARHAYADGTWTGVSMQWGGESPGTCELDVTSGVFYNDTAKGGYQRWEAGADTDPVPDDFINLVAVTTKGLIGYLDPGSVGEGAAPEYYYHSLLGEIDFCCFGDTPAPDCPVYFEAGGGGFTVAGGTTQESVYFGFGDAPIVNSAPQGTRTALPDLFVECIPEPTSILLLGVAGFLLRRR